MLTSKRTEHSVSSPSPRSDIHDQVLGYQKFFRYIPLGRKHQALARLDRAMAAIRIQSTVRGTLDRARVRSLRQLLRAQQQFGQLRETSDDLSELFSLFCVFGIPFDYICQAMNAIVVPSYHQRMIWKDKGLGGGAGGTRTSGKLGGNSYNNYNNTNSKSNSGKSNSKNNSGKGNSGKGNNSNSSNNSPNQVAGAWLDQQSVEGISSATAVDHSVQQQQQPTAAITTTAAVTPSAALKPTITTTTTTTANGMTINTEHERVYGNFLVEAKPLTSRHKHRSQQQSQQRIESLSYSLSPEGMKWLRKLVDTGRIARALTAINAFEQEQSYWADILLSDVYLARIECLFVIEDFYSIQLIFDTKFPNFVKETEIQMKEMKEMKENKQKKENENKENNNFISSEDIERNMKLLKYFAKLQFSIGKYNNAIVYYSFALELLQQQERQSLLSPRRGLQSLQLSIQNELIDAFLAIGFYSEAFQFIKLMKTIKFNTSSEQSGNCLLCSQLIVSLANWHKLTNNAIEAERGLQLAISIQSENVNPTHIAIGQTQLQLVGLLLENNEFKRAEELLLSAFELINNVYQSVVNTSNSNSNNNNNNDNSDRYNIFGTTINNQQENNHSHLATISNNQLTARILASKYSPWLWSRPTSSSTSADPQQQQQQQQMLLHLGLFSLAPPALITKDILTICCYYCQICLWKNCASFARELCRYCMEAMQALGYDNSNSSSNSNSNSNSSAATATATAAMDEREVIGCGMSTAAMVYATTGDIYRRTGYTLQAVSYLTRAYELRKAITSIAMKTDTNHSLQQLQLSTALFALGCVYYDLGRILLSIEYFTNAIQMRQSILQILEVASDKELEKYKIWLAKGFLLIGRLEEAESQLGATNYAIDSTTNTAVAAAASIRSYESLAVLAQLCCIRGRYADASLLYQRSLRQLSHENEFELSGTDEIQNQIPIQQQQQQQLLSIEAALLSLEYADMLRIPGYFHEAAQLLHTATVSLFHNLNKDKDGQQERGKVAMHDNDSDHVSEEVDIGGNMFVIRALFLRAQLLRDLSQLEESQRYYMQCLYMLRTIFHRSQGPNSSPSAAAAAAAAAVAVAAAVSASASLEVTVNRSNSCNNNNNSNTNNTSTAANTAPLSPAVTIVEREFDDSSLPLLIRSSAVSATNINNNNSDNHNNKLATIDTSDIQSNYYYAVILGELGICLQRQEQVHFDSNSNNREAEQHRISSQAILRKALQLRQSVVNHQHRSMIVLECLLQLVLFDINLSFLNCDENRIESSFVLLNEVMLSQVLETVGSSATHPFVIYLKAIGGMCVHLIDTLQVKGNRNNNNNNNNNSNQPTVSKSSDENNATIAIATNANNSSFHRSLILSKSLESDSFRIPLMHSLSAELSYLQPETAAVASTTTLFIGKQVIDNCITYLQSYEQMPFTSTHPWIVMLQRYLSSADTTTK